MHKVLKTFRYSPDGVRVVTLSEGDECEISASVADGLAAEGFIGPVGAAPAPDAPSAFDPAAADTYTSCTRAAMRASSSYAATITVSASVGSPSSGDAPYLRAHNAASNG